MKMNSFLIIGLFLFASICNCSHEKIQNDSFVKMKLLVSLTTILKTQSLTGTNTETITILANQNSEKNIQAKGEWQTANNKIEGNVQIILSATGSWSMTNDETLFGSDGLSSNPSFFGDYRVDKKFNHGQLICRLHTIPGNLFSIGTLTVNGSGSIECRMNDTDVSNNTGYVTVAMKVNHN